MVTKNPGKQRKHRYNAPLHRKRRMVSSLLHPELRAKYGQRTAPVRKGDLVKVARGSHSGHVGKVLKVNVRLAKISVEKVTLKKADGKETEKWIDASNVIIVKLDLSDKKRRDKLGKAAETAFAEESDKEEAE